MRRIAFILLMLVTFTGSVSAAGSEDLRAALSTIEGDYRAFYLDGRTMGLLGAGVMGGGIMANSAADREANEFYQDNIRSGATDSFSDIARIPGDVLVAVPLLFGAYALSGDGTVKSWAGDSLRGIAVGAPVGLFIQYAAGASRPEESSSGWKPFKGNNSLSGHAFIGAVPLITAAKRQEGIAMKSLFYGLSVLPGLSRINDEKHYLSQASLGWFLAYLSASSLERKNENASIVISPFTSGFGITLSSSF